MLATNPNKNDRSAIVLFGSETGNASGFAQEIAALVERLRFSVYIRVLDDVEPSLLSSYSVVVIIISTTGQGDLPANARHFWKSLLRRKLPPTYLSDVQFTTFGLGHSSYPRFNWAARKLHKRLVQLGANELYSRGEADEQHEEGLDASFVPWSTDLRRHLLETFPLENGLKPIPDETLLEPRWILELVPNVDIALNGLVSDRTIPALEKTSSSTSLDKSTSPPNAKSSSLSHERMRVRLDENTRVTPKDYWQDVRHLVFSTPSATSYGPGDVLTIYPRNAPEDVDQIITAMGWSDVADMSLRFAQTPLDRDSRRHTFQSSQPFAITSETTLRDLLNTYLDLNAIPKRSFFSVIAHFTDDKTQKERLLEFTKPEYIDELYDYTTRPRRSTLEVLQEFGTVMIPWQWAATVLPRLRGRQFSIASGGDLKKDADGNTRIELLVAIVKYKTVIKKFREGICTRYLSNLPVGSSLDVSLQEGSLGITQAQAQRPLVMIGPGTGIAPIRSLIWERLGWKNALWHDQSHTNGDSIAYDHSGLGEMLLFFGCRKKGADYFFREEWEQLRHQLPLKVFPAISRDQHQKIYVQDLIKEQFELVYRLLHHEKGIVYVCGSSGKMPQAVRMALTEAFTRYGNMHQGDAEAYLQIMEKEGRYKQETW